LIKKQTGIGRRDTVLRWGRKGRGEQWRKLDRQTKTNTTKLLK
jgi:hypothetical protein